MHNLQGDIVAILDSNGTAVVQYKYDAWGRQIDCTFETGNNAAEALNTLNPFRYRGYVYDEETGLYYLDTRYYEPFTQRFLSADKLLSCVGLDLHSHNTYCYCINRPICYLDNEGCWPDWGAVLKVAAVVTAVIAAVAITVTTCGAGSVAGTMVISSALGIAARGAEVAVLQGKQSYQDGDSFEEGVTDVVNAWVNNGSTIVKPQSQVLKGVTYGFGIYSQSSSFAPVLELMTYDGLTLGRKMPFCMIPQATPTAVGNVLGSMLSDVGDRYANAGYHLRTEASTIGKVIGYAGAAWDGANLCISVFSSDPSERAKQRGYQLE